jgi:hypothetical protein
MSVRPVLAAGRTLFNGSLAGELAKERKMTAEMDAFLGLPLLARLATANPHTLQPHVVPVWYGWDGQRAWISAFRSTRKVKDLRLNLRASLVVDVDSPAALPPEVSGLTAALLEGPVELVEGPLDLLVEKTAWIYTRYLGAEGVLAPDPQSWMHDPENLLICLTPERVKTWK